MSDAVGPARTVPYRPRGCALHKYHDPTPLILQQHHVFPLELQKRVWPDVSRDNPATIRSPHTIDICGTGHDSIHEMIRRLLAGKPLPRGRPAERHYAQAAFVLFKAAQEKP